MKRSPDYRWALVGALGLTEMISWGVLYYGYAIFMRPMQLELHLSRTQVSGAFSLGLAVSGVAAVPVGRWLDRHGSRGLMTVGSVAAAAPRRRCVCPAGNDGEGARRAVAVARPHAPDAGAVLHAVVHGHGRDRHPSDRAAHGARP